MDDKIEWTNATVMRFLELYQMHPCIWDPKHEYHRKQSRVQDAWMDILHNLQLPEKCTVKQLKKKRESLMSAYRGYRCRIRLSETGETDATEVYKPVWFAYSFMDSFLGDVYQCKPPKNSGNKNHHDEDSNSDSEEIDGDSETSSNVEQKYSSTLSQPTAKQRTSTETAPKRTQKSVQNQQAKKQMNETATNLRSAPNLLSAPNLVSAPFERNDEDECHFFGKIIASKMRKLPEDRRDLMMIKINQLFYEECHGQNVPSSSTMPIQFYTEVQVKKEI